MKERPILFNAPMIRALLEGRKTQTRRIAKVHETSPGYISPDMCFVPRTPQEHVSYCPYGVPGDRLWVRETFALENNEGSDGCDEFAAPRDGRPVRHHAAINEYDSDYDLYPRYRATEDAYLACEHEKCNEACGPCQHPWRPSIFMPRWASRITLEITDVRVERVQEISHNDALAEGVEYDTSKPDGAPVPRFHALWDSINGKNHPFAANDLVWALTFRVL